ncbi:MAG: 4Fe-4S binding protein [archaeon]
MKEKITTHLTEGAVIIKPGSSIKNKTGSWRVFKPLVLKNRCAGCGTCVNYCPDCCIRMKNKKAAIDYDYCKGCGICAKECPAKAIIIQREEKLRCN